MAKLDNTTLLKSVSGINLQGNTLRKELEINNLNLLVFLRHFGWPFCRETVKDLRVIASKQPNYPSVLFFGQGDVKETQEFFNGFWPEARAVSDKEHFFYQAFGLKQASLSTMLTPAAWMRTVETTLKGNFVGKFVGDIWMMPGVFLVKKEDIIWQHDFKHAGDHPDFTKIPEYAK